MIRGDEGSSRPVLAFQTASVASEEVHARAPPPDRPASINRVVATACCA